MKQILFIEDDPILGTVYEARLKSAGFDVSRFSDGEAGLKALQTSRPDLILLDMMLPRVSGLQLLQFIRSNAELSEVPVVVFSSVFKEELLTEIRSLGVQRILSKSQFVPREVIAVINELLHGPGGSAADALRVEADRVEARRAVQRQLDEQLAACRQLVADVGHKVDDEERLPLLENLRAPVRRLVSLASAGDQKAQSYFCDAVDVLLGELCRRPDRLNASTLRTVFQAVDFLFAAFDPGLKVALPAELSFQILMVDDDSIARRAIQAALRRIKQQAQECESAMEAMQLAAERTFDLIFVDMEMPGMRGAELCARFRASVNNRHTPVIFVTGHTDLQTRAQSTLSGGNDFIGKPFHFMELAVKALLHLLRGKLH